MTSPPAITPACLELSASPIAASYARQHIASVLPAWGREDLIDPAQLVISELVTNAVNKATLDASAPSLDPYDHPKVADWIFIPHPYHRLPQRSRRGAGGLGHQPHPAPSHRRRPVGRRWPRTAYRRRAGHVLGLSVAQNRRQDRLCRPRRRLISRWVG